jgi:hypothetical protein
MSSLVMTARYGGASEIRAVSEHERNRVPDGSSAIDPGRSHLNRILIGPRPVPGRRPISTQKEALDALYASGVKKPAKQAERPFVQMVLSASSGYFRAPGHGPGEWDPEKLRKWTAKTMRWLKAEYGVDVVHTSLHLDEDTPHIHVLIVPTYQKKPRRPGRRKRNCSASTFLTGADNQDGRFWPLRTDRLFGDFLHDVAAVVRVMVDAGGCRFSVNLR